MHRSLHPLADDNVPISGCVGEFDSSWLRFEGLDGFAVCFPNHSPR
ncbi:hypothetical protein GA0061103_0004 [Rhizobium multihospitium]|uniref:Uncharacterized protein n=1 Tax=Rhizobium multihospitium TaxID=410764 RepID=A0A1C3X3D6_9HYPH|nr:hypothetical protein GA0061103_0004 [Rhizobium multihospitium]